MVSDSITGPNPTMYNKPHESSGASTQPTARAEAAVEKLQAQFPDIFFEVRRFRDEVTVFVPRENIVEVARFCKSGPDMGYDYLSDLTGNDWPDRDPRFEVIYQLYSMQHFTYLRLQVRVPEDDITVPSVTSVWGTANWHERETFSICSASRSMASRFAPHLIERRLGRTSFAPDRRNWLGTARIHRAQSAARLRTRLVGDGT
jgi:NADH-quinone oxidoreductase subunit C